MMLVRTLSAIVAFLCITITAFFTDGNPAHFFEFSTASAGGQCGPFNKGADDCKAKARKRFGPEYCFNVSRAYPGERVGAQFIGAVKLGGGVGAGLAKTDIQKAAQCASHSRKVAASLGGDVRYIQIAGGYCYYYRAGSSSGPSGKLTFRFDPAKCSADNKRACAWNWLHDSVMGPTTSAFSMAKRPEFWLDSDTNKPCPLLASNPLGSAKKYCFRMKNTRYETVGPRFHKVIKIPNMPNGKRPKGYREEALACAAIGRPVSNSLGGDVRYIQPVDGYCYYYRGGSQSGRSGWKTHRFDPVACNKPKACSWSDNLKDDQGWHIKCNR